LPPAPEREGRYARATGGDDRHALGGVGEREVVAVRPLEHREVVVRVSQPPEVGVVDDSIVVTGDEHHRAADPVEPGGRLGGDDHLLKSLGVGGPRVLDGVGRDLAWQTRVGQHGNPRRERPVVADPPARALG